MSALRDVAGAQINGAVDLSGGQVQRRDLLGGLIHDVKLRFPPGHEQSVNNLRRNTRQQRVVSGG